MPAEELSEIPLKLATRLLHPKPAIIVISSDSSGRVNGMAAAWITPIARSPPTIGFSIASQRYTYELIKESKEFTLNIVDADYVDQVHLLGTISGRDRDKLKESGLTLVASKNVKPPHIKEALAVLECRVKNELEIGDRIFIIAEVVAAYARKDLFTEVYDPEKARILMQLGGANYTTITNQLIKPKEK